MSDEISRASPSPKEHERSLEISDREKSTEQELAATDPVSPARFGKPRICGTCLLVRAKCKCEAGCCAEGTF